MHEDRTIRQPVTPTVKLRAPMQSLTDWRLVEVKDLTGTAPNATMLVGPAIGESSASVSEGFGASGGGFGDRAGSSDSRLNSGIFGQAGRWVIPTTRRIRGITQGSIQVPDGGSGGGDGASGESSGFAPLMSGGGGGASDTLIVSSDSRCDIVLFPAGSRIGELRLVLRGWKAGFTGPDDSEASEVPTSLTLPSGSYCVVTTDPDKRMQRAVAYPWTLAPGAQQRHPPDVIEVVNRINAQIRSRGLSGKMRLLTVPAAS